MVPLVNMPKTEGQAQISSIQLVGEPKKEVPMFLKTTTSFKGDGHRKPLPRSMSIERGNHRKKLHENEKKTRGYSKTRPGRLCSSSAPWSSLHQVGESVMTRHFFMNKGEESRVMERFREGSKIF